MKVADTIEKYDDWKAAYGFDLWGEWGEDHEVYSRDKNLASLLEAGRIVSLVNYDADCDDACNDDGHTGTCPYVYGDNDFVMRGWAMVDVIRRVVLPIGWRN